MIQETLTLILISVACINNVTCNREPTPSVEYTEQIFNLFPSCHHHILLTTEIAFGQFLSPKRIFSCPAYLQKNHSHNKTLIDKDIITSCKRFDQKDSLNYFHWSSMRSIAAGGCQTFFVFNERMIPDLNHVRRRNELRSFIKFQGIQSNTYFLLIFPSLTIKRYRFFSLPLVTPNVFYVLSLAWSQAKSKTPNNHLLY